MPTIHVIDDNHDVRERLVRFWRIPDAVYAPMRRQRIFLSEADNEIRGCVIADLRMPGMSGFDAYGRDRRTTPWAPRHHHDGRQLR